jgi:hypothetical protein
MLDAAAKWNSGENTIASSLKMKRNEMRRMYPAQRPGWLLAALWENALSGRRYSVIFRAECYHGLQTAANARSQEVQEGVQQTYTRLSNCGP